jgi:glycosyltransferase involved in cell wall biosynthesis
MRVLHVGKFYPPAPGGMERVVQLLCENERPEVDSVVLAANTSPHTVREVWHGVPVTRVASVASIGSVGICPTFPAVLARTPRDITVIHEPNPAALVSDWITRGRGPLVVWFHSEVVRARWKYNILYRPFLRRALTRADRIVVSSPRLADHARELADFRSKCVVIPFGIDVERLEATPAVTARAAQIVAEHPGPRVLFIGRLVPYKGVDVLIDAMASVPRATALILGDGPLRGELAARAAASGVAGRVRFLGALPDAEVVAHLHACDVFVLPSVSRQETFGVAQLEAMACGRPVVSTDLETGVPWVNQHEVTGLVVPPGNSERLSDALGTLLSDEALRNRLGAAARERVEREFTTERMAQRTVSLYRDVLAGATC